MCDSELTEWLKDQGRRHGAIGHVGTAARFLEAAARLEALSGAAAGSPLTPQREAEIRKRADNPFHGNDRDTASVRDLLAALDHERAHRVRAEGVIQDQCAESAVYEAGVREGVARAFERVTRLRDQYAEKSEASPSNMTFLGGRMTLDAALVALRVCGPAELPPHAVSHARLLRLEAALQEISQLDLPVGQSLAHPLHTVQKVAREALERNP